MPEHDDLDARLRRYGDTLDREAARVSASEDTSLEHRPTRRVGRLVFAGVAAAALIAVAVTFQQGDSDVQTVATPPNRPTPSNVGSAAGGVDPDASRLPRLVVDGWSISGFHSSTDGDGEPARHVFLQSFRDPAAGFNGSAVTLFTLPNREHWGSGEGARELTVKGQPAWLMPFPPLSTLLTWHPSDGRLVAIYGTRVSDSELVAIANGLEDRAPGWEPTTLPSGLVEITAGPASAVVASAETKLVRGGERLELRQMHAASIEFESLVQDRINSAAELREVIVNGEPGALVRYAEGTERWSAMWYADGTVHELDGRASEASFLRALGSIRSVSQDEWLRALPPNLIRPQDRANEVDRMLEGVPTPPGFDKRSLQASDEPIERYQLVAAVSGAVACSWMEQDGKEARDAMADVRSWPMLQSIVDEGDYAEVLWEVADGWLAGRINSEEIDSSLGCP